MQLNHLCFLLSRDLDEKTKPTNKHHRHHRRKRILGFIRRLVCRLRNSNWINFCQVDASGKHFSSEFFDSAGVQFTETVGGNNPRVFSYAELYIGSNGFHESELLGSGGFGKVYRATLPSDGTAVAVKCVAKKGERFEKSFMAELMAVAHLRHRNLVRLRGWCIHEDSLLLVYDYMPNRSLDQVLFRRPENSPLTAILSWDRRWKIVRGLAAALFYLHEQLETQIIHRDVKTSNVMLDSHYNARLGDFGLARWREHELEFQTKIPPSIEKNNWFRVVETTIIGGTIGYLPPESFQKRSTATAKSDVFSFGIVVLEVVSGRRAVDLTCSDEEIILLDRVRQLSDEGMLLKIGDHRLPDGSYSLYDMDRLIHLGLLCTLNDPQSRPHMKWVVDALSGDISGQFPNLPSFHSHPLYITLSSSSTDTTTTTTTASTVTIASSNYVTAVGETIFATADTGCFENGGRRTTSCFSIQTPREISFQEIISATNNFSDSHRVAELDFGTAYQGYLENKHRVLVKRLGMKTCPALRARFSDELRNLGNLRHRNLVHLRGWCTEQGEMLVVYDYSANRLLSHNLFHNRSVLKWHHRYSIIKSLSSAILYLHEEWEEQVIHRSITSSAVILDPDMNPRLSSFALAEFLTRNETGHYPIITDKNQSVRGIFGYMSPEYMEHGVATPSADVYSFGVVVLEVVTAQMAVDFRRPEVLLVKRIREFEARKRAFTELVDWRLDGDYDHRELERVVKLGMACTKSDPNLRPTMREIVSILDGNDACFKEEWLKEEKREEWQQRNATSLALIRRIQALGIQ